jgi:hypothetical protein
MRAFITSIGEPTTQLCEWSLQRNGFDTCVVLNPDSLAQKLQWIYNHTSEDFLRVDADIIVNRNLTPELLDSLNKDIWWWQFRCFDWFQQDLGYNLSFHRSETIDILRKNVTEVLTSLRPETELSRIPEFYNPRRFETYEGKVMGLHGFGIKELEAVKELKKARNQLDNYDFGLTEKLNDLR